jgi:hypothetical protein
MDMTYETAVSALEAARNTGKLEDVRQTIDAYERQAGSSNHWESSRLLRHACDVINSHDFGDHKGQMDLIWTYARRALQRSHYASLEQELRLLAHLQYDYEDGSEPWPEKRSARSRSWLRALQLLAEATREAALDDLPRHKTAPPALGLPLGIAPEQVADADTRNLYRSEIDRNREDAEAFALRWKMKHLRRTYESLGAKYICSAYAREPFDLLELKHLLDAYMIDEPDVIRKVAGLHSSTQLESETDVRSKPRSTPRRVSEHRSSVRPKKKKT